MKRLLLIVAGILGFACGTTPAGPPPVVAEYQSHGGHVFTAYPSDRFAVADPSSPTGIRVQIDAQAKDDLLVAKFPQTLTQLDALDGFSTVGGVVATFSGPLDVRGIAVDPKADPPDPTPLRDASDYTRPGAPFYLVDSDPKSPERGTLVGLVPQYSSQEPDLDYAADYTVLAQPARPLRPATRYLFAATNALHGKDGASVVPSAETTALLGSASTAYASAVADGLGLLREKVGLRKESVVLATSFTTGSVTRDMFGMASRARTQPPPAVVEPWSVERPMDSSGRVRFRVRIDVPDYRYASDGTWHDENGAPKEDRRVSLEVFLAFSDGKTSGKRPVVIYQHGLGGDKGGTLGVAGDLADLGCAVVGIDAPEHGSRAPNGSTDTFVWLSSFLGMDLAAGTFDITRARDNFRQTASDQLELVRFLGSLGTLDLLPIGAPDGVPDLDVSKLLYVGQSLGSVQGATIFAIAPEISHAVWTVGGAGLTMLLRDSGVFGLVFKGLLPPGTSTGELTRFFAALQAIIDPGDAANYARYAASQPPPGVAGWAPRDVLLQESIPDGVVSNASTETLARALGLVNQNALVAISGLPSQSGAITGNFPGGATGVLAQFDKINGTSPSSHGELIGSPEAKKQSLGFFVSGLANGHATVPPAYP